MAVDSRGGDSGGRASGAVGLGDAELIESERLKSQFVRAPAFVALLALAVAVPPGMAADFGRLVKTAGDRQIIVGPFATKGNPFSVVILDTQEQPIANVAVTIQATQGINPNLPPDISCPTNADEFGFFGFNIVTYGESCGSFHPNGATFGYSNALGELTLSAPIPNEPPSAFLIGAKAHAGIHPDMADRAHVQFFTVIRAVSAPAGEPVVVVEYFHDGYRNYFNTIDQVEIDGLDAGVFSGWTREVGGFIAWPSQSAAPAGAVPVCRFFASVFTSHFYTADTVECDAVVANFPEWQLETREAYWIVLPDKATGACGAGLMPVYRVLKPSFSNHRYVTDRAVRDTMVAAGWIAEGYGPDAVIMCTPR